MHKLCIILTNFKETTRYKNSTNQTYTGHPKIIKKYDFRIVSRSTPGVP